MISKIEIAFPVPVEMPKGWDRRLHDMVREICEDYKKKKPERVMWVFGYGDKPVWSQQDAAFLGVDTPEAAPAGGEPSFDSSVFMIEVAEREKH